MIYGCADVLVHHPMLNANTPRKKHRVRGINFIKFRSNQGIAMKLAQQQK